MLLPRSLVGKCQFNLAVQLASKRGFGSAKESPFPVHDSPLVVHDGLAVKRSKVAEKALVKTVFACQSGGGEKGAHKHTVVNKKVLVRDRIRHILDDDSEFFEICTTAGLGLDYGDVPGAGTVTGVGKIRKNLVMIVASDGSLKGGTSYPITVTKSLRAQEIAMENRLPCLYVVDSGGAFLPLQAEIFPDVKHGGRTFRNQAVMSGLGIPQVAIVAGPCTAGGAYTPTMSDEAIMVNKIGHVFLGGPPLVKAATGEVVTHEDLGGAKLHTSESGVADYFAKDERESFSQVRDIVSGLNLDPPKDFDHTSNPPIFASEELEYFGGLNHMCKEDVQAVMARIVDFSRFSEFKKTFGHNLICAFAKLSNQTVGICANSGRLSGADGQKGTHFLQLCEARNIPVIFLQNNSGQDEPRFLTPEELKESGKFAHVSANLTVPKISVNIGGIGGPQDLVSMCGPSFGPRFQFAWPRARFSKLELAPRGDEEPKPLFDTDFPEDSAQFAASRCTIDAVILPRETRFALSTSLQIAMLNHSIENVRRFQQNSVQRI